MKPLPNLRPLLFTVALCAVFTVRAASLNDPDVPESAKKVPFSPPALPPPTPVPESQLAKPPPLRTTPLVVAQLPKDPNQPPRQMEKLGRGVVVLNQGNGKVWISWRMFGTDPDDIAFNIYRSTGGRPPVKLNKEPITDVTFYQDTGVDTSSTNEYAVKPVIKGVEGEFSKPFLNKLAANAPVRNYIEIPMKTPPGYQINDCSVGDLDGDGEYEIVVHMASAGRDNSQAGITGEPILQAYKMDGTMLWQINLGKNIREGAHYTQFLVYDFDGDGRAEMICKTAPGTIDGTNNWVLMKGDNPNADYRNQSGYVLSGPEYLTVFEGLTGKALDTVKYVPARAPDTLNPTGQEINQLWGDAYGNRLDRYNAAVAYADGVHPSAIMCRGYYTWTNLVAWDFKDGKLTQRWYFNGNDYTAPGNGRGADPTIPRYNGQGDHNLNVADADGDGKDDIIYGAMVVRSDGKPLWSTNYGHGDAMHTSDLDPDNPGLEEFDIQERFSDAGAHMNDLRTGKTLWKLPSVAAATAGGDAGEGPGRGLAADIDPRFPGYESWSLGAGMTGLYNDKGERISNNHPSSCNFLIQWDGDTLFELLDGNHIDKWNWETQSTVRLFTAEGCASNNGTKSTPCISGDLFGDWREELALRTTDNSAIRIFVSEIPTNWRMYTLMHDPQYRLGVAWEQSCYNQPPHPGFYFGANMPTPPKPNIVLVEPKLPPATITKK